MNNYINTKITGATRIRIVIADATHDATYDATCNVIANKSYGPIDDPIWVATWREPYWATGEFLYEL